MYYALCEQDFEQVAVINPAHAKALRGHKTDAKDCARLAELFECGLLRGSYIPPAELREVRDLTRYRIKTVQARTSEIQRLAKALESAGIKLGSVASDITGVSATAMIESLIDGERRGAVLADLARGRMRTAGKLTDLSMALTGRFTDHHALLCRLHRDRITVLDEAVAGLDGRIAGKVTRWQREADLLTSVPGFGVVVTQAWLGEIGPAPHRHFATCEKLASWVTLCPGNNISARKRKHGRTGDAGTYIKPMLIQAAWAAIRVRGRLQARYSRLVRRFGGDKNPGAKKKAITAIAHTLLKIAYQVLKSGIPYQEARALRWAHVDLDGDPAARPPVPPHVAVWRSVRVHGETKTERSRRTLGLPAAAVQALRTLRESQAEERLAAGDGWQHTGLVFTNHLGAALDAGNVRKMFKRVCTEAGIGDGWTPRELRTSFVSLLSHRGVSIEEIARLVGHASTRTTEIVYRRELRPVITTGAEIMDELFTGI